MELLSDADVKGLLGFLHEASEALDPHVFSEPVVEALWRLIPADGGAACVTVAGANPAVPADARTMLTFAEIDCEWCVGVQTPWTDELELICRQYIEQQDPLPPVPRFINHPFRRSDVVRKREYQRRELWAEVERRAGIEDSLRLWFEVPGEEGLRRIEFASSRESFSERDLRVLELLAPHLIRLYRRAARRQTWSPVLDVLTPREREVIALVAAGKTNREAARYLWISPHTVRAHLENIFEKLEVTTRAAAVARVLAGPPD